MARIATNTAGSQPSIFITTNLNTDGNNPFKPNWGSTAGSQGFPGNINVPFIQDVTVTNSTGVYSYTTFSDVAMRKLSTPADNEISFNVVIDDTTWFGDRDGMANASAAYEGLQALSGNSVAIGFRIYYNDQDGRGTEKNYQEGTGFITSLAPTVSPEAPVWVTPMTIAVDGLYTPGNSTYNP